MEVQEDGVIFWRACTVYATKHNLKIWISLESTLVWCNFWDFECIAVEVQEDGGVFGGLVPSTQ